MKKAIIITAIIISLFIIAVASRMIYNAHTKVPAASRTPKNNIWLLLDADK